MKKIEKMICEYKYKCMECNRETPIYYDYSDFGYDPEILKCKFCGVHYWYYSEETFYQKPLNEQLSNKKCVKCEADLKSCLVPTYRNIECCGSNFSIDENFYKHNICKDVTRVTLEVYLIYSE